MLNGRAFVRCWPTTHCSVWNNWSLKFTPRKCRHSVGRRHVMTSLICTTRWQHWSLPASAATIIITIPWECTRRSGQENPGLVAMSLAILIFIFLFLDDLGSVLDFLLQGNWLNLCLEIHSFSLNVPCFILDARFCRFLHTRVFWLVSGYFGGNITMTEITHRISIFP